MTTIGVLHAYSRTNAGDGLLVDLTIDRLARLGLGLDDVFLVALDPDSFPEVPHRTGIGTRGRGVSWDLVPAARRGGALAVSALVQRRVGEVARALDRCDGLVAVGGGYLRAVDVTSSVGTALNHLPQLLAAARSKVPSFYLPQSIGPLRGPVGSAVARALRHLDAVCARDRWSAAELGSVPGLRRIPDLAVLELGERWDDVALALAPAGGRVGFVARQVGHAGGYEDVVRSLAADLGDRAVWAVQTAGDPTKSDAVHYSRIGVTAGGSLTDLLATGDLSVVVSVRLHGALMALRAGVPAVHLAYDRKGPAAFADLGLSDWCFDVRSIDRSALAAAVAGLVADPGPYWDQLSGEVPQLRKASAGLDEMIRCVLGTT
jgi:polysaccharide pyruvyl transferase WcaK-like protein